MAYFAAAVLVGSTWLQGSLAKRPAGDASDSVKASLLELHHRGSFAGGNLSHDSEVSTFSTGKAGEAAAQHHVGKRAEDNGNASFIDVSARTSERCRGIPNCWHFADMAELLAVTNTAIKNGPEGEVGEMLTLFPEVQHRSVLQYLQWTAQENEVPSKVMVRAALEVGANDGGESGGEKEQAERTSMLSKFRLRRSKQNVTDRAQSELVQGDGSGTRITISWLNLVDNENFKKPVERSMLFEKDVNYDA